MARAIAATLGALALVSSALVGQGQSSARFVLPEPTGPHAVGSTRWAETDDDRPEPFVNGAARRQVTVTLWYPARDGAAGPRAPYLREGLGEVQTWARTFRDSPDALNEIGQVTTHASLEAPPIDATNLPLLIFSHGYTSTSSAHTALFEDLASHGYAVVSINHPYEATGTTLNGGRTASTLGADGAPLPALQQVLAEWADEDATLARVTATSDVERQRAMLRAYLASLPRTTDVLHRWVADTRLVVSRLASPGRATSSASRAVRWSVNLDRFGIFGHSMGGVVAGEYCLEDAHCAAALNLDGSPQSGAMIDRRFGRPFLMVYSARPGRVGANDAIYARSASPYYRADVADTKHLDVADFVLWPPFRSRGLVGAIAPGHAVDITRQLVREYFDDTLQNRPSPLLSNVRTIPGVQIRAVSGEVKAP